MKTPVPNNLELEEPMTVATWMEALGFHRGSSSITDCWWDASGNHQITDWVANTFYRVYCATKVLQPQLPSVHAGDVDNIDCPACGHPTLRFEAGKIVCCLADCEKPLDESIAAREARLIEEAHMEGRHD